MRLTIKHNVRVAILALSLIGTAHAGTLAPIVWNNSNLHWQPIPSMPNILMAAIKGDPTKKEHFIARIKIPANAVLPVHMHAITEYDTVISGTYFLGVGDTLNLNVGISLPQGTFVEIPASFPHYGYTHEETVLQIEGTGPWGTTSIKHT